MVYLIFINEAHKEPTTLNEYGSLPCKNDSTTALFAFALSLLLPIQEYQAKCSAFGVLFAQLIKINNVGNDSFSRRAMLTSELNHFLLILTAIVTCIALVLVLYIYCHYKCGFCRRKQKHSSTLPEVRITMHNDAKRPLSVDSPDIDFIDSRNTNLVSSTVRVSSVHNTPHQL
ncbi:unnamed protein product [Cylicocyclus nassatus]|uniref:Uncharacterized protein n=1 Tax=Cylicocyclus nassatus TaxID=53992 RepID=A0AA36DLJ0_CYLNA|nr:unnamed protein product [Cylicocyclus nassatus]